MGIPGTGIYYASHTGRHSGFHSAHQETLLGPQEQAGQDRKAERVLIFVVMAAIVMVALALVLSAAP